MEPVIRVKDYLMKELLKMLAPEEQVQVAMPFGRMQSEQGQAGRAHDVDYLLLTDKRIIHIKGRFFKDRIGFNAYPRRLVTGADAKHFLVGSTIKVLFRNEAKNDEQIEFVFQNCSKPEAEAIVKELTDQIETRCCPQCMRKLNQDYTFCPYCRAVLKKLCSKCGKPQEKDWVSCHHCGG
jgi:hypothetical protein